MENRCSSSSQPSGVRLLALLQGQWKEILRREESNVSLMHLYGTGTHYTIAAFLGTWLTRFTTLFRSTSRLRIIQRICLLYTYPACTGLSIPGSCFPHASLQF